MWSEVVKDLERLWERPIVSDAYRPFESVATDRRTVVQGERLERYLDRTCRIWKRRWGYAAPVLTFQRLDWLLHRPMQLPESRARHWKQQAIETNHWALDHVQEMVTLSPMQLAKLSSVLGPQTDQFLEQGDLLLLWKELPGNVQQRLTRGGVPLRDLPVGMQPTARSLVAGILGTEEPLALANARLRMESSEDVFALHVEVPGAPARTRRLELACLPAWIQQLRNEEAARVAALRAAAGLRE
jgi:hypothetical protein